MKNERFLQIEGASVILKSKGFSKEADIYRYNCLLYAKHNQSYIRLKSGGLTSTYWMWDDMIGINYHETYNGLSVY